MDGKGCWWRHLRLALLPLLAAAALPATASADPAVVTKLAVSELVVSCTGELVLLTGEETIVDKSSLDSSGGLHVKFGIEMRGLKGVGMTSGATYTGLDTTENEVQIPQGASEATFVNNYSLIRQGEIGSLVGDDLRTKQLVHMTFNSAGVLTSYKDEFRTDCT